VAELSSFVQKDRTNVVIFPAPLSKALGAYGILFKLIGWNIKK
jgi:hypothetical protein